MMHRLRLLSLCFLSALFLLTACSSDDEGIAGTYKLISFSSAGCTDPLENFNFDFSANDGCTTLLGEEVCGDGTLTLTESGSFSYSLDLTSLGQTFTFSGSGSYTVDGNMITICDNEDCETSTFSLGSGRITISFSESGDPCVLTMTGEKT